MRERDHTVPKDPASQARCVGVESGEVGGGRGWGHKLIRVWDLSRILPFFHRGPVLVHAGSSCGEDLQVSQGSCHKAHGCGESVQGTQCKQHFLEQDPHGAAGVGRVELQQLLLGTFGAG